MHSVVRGTIVLLGGRATCFDGGGLSASPLTVSETIPHTDVLVALASRAARLRLLAIAGHCAQWCAAAPRLSSRVRSAYIKAAYIKDLARMQATFDEATAKKQAVEADAYATQRRMDSAHRRARRRVHPLEGGL